MLGEWYSVKGDFETYSFMKDNNSYIFTGNQDQRPVILGTWRIEKNKFVFTSDIGTKRECFFSLVNDTLIFNEGDEIYTRTLPMEVRFPEIRILNDLASAFSSHKFSSPDTVNFPWLLWSDSIKSYKVQLLKGFGISMSSILADDMENLVGFLEDHGFTRDSVNITSVCAGLVDGNQAVSLCKNQETVSPNEPNDIFVLSAIIK